MINSKWMAKVTITKKKVKVKARVKMKKTMIKL